MTKDENIVDTAPQPLQAGSNSRKGEQVAPRQQKSAKASALQRNIARRKQQQRARQDDA